MARTGANNDSTTRRRWTALLAVLALVVQVLLPLSQARAAWDEEGLFPPVCSFLPGDAGDMGRDGDATGHCPLCQLAAAVALEPPAWTFPAVWPTPAATPLTPLDDAPAQSACLPASPPRGPPSRA